MCRVLEVREVEFPNAIKLVKILITLLPFKICLLLVRVSMVFFQSHMLDKYRLWPHWFAAFEVTIMAVVVGSMGGWTSPYLTKLTSPDSPFPVTEGEASWIASLLNFGRLIGAIVGAFAVEYFGSKKTVHICGMPQALSWAFVILADSVEWLYVARIFSGICLGMLFVSFPLYIGEVSDPCIRGALIGLVMTSLSVGMTIGNCMGPYMDMWLFASIMLVPNVTFLASFFILPESPHYLVQTGRLEAATKSIAWYHRDIDVSNELESLKRFTKKSESMSFKSKWNELFVPHNRRAFIMAVTLFFFMQLSGFFSIMYYMEIILINAKVTVIVPSTVVILSSAIGIFAGWISLYIIDKFSRKIVLAVSSAGVSMALSSLSLHYLLLQLEYDPTKLEWLPICSIFLFMCFICVGVLTIPNTILSEIFPSNIKSIVSCVLSIISGVLAFVCSKTYQPLVNLMSEQYVFLMYAIAMLILAIYSLYKVPETKGKTLQEIQEMLLKK